MQAPAHSTSGTRLHDYSLGRDRANKPFQKHALGERKPAVNKPRPPADIPYSLGDLVFVYTGARFHYSWCYSSRIKVIFSSHFSCLRCLSAAVNQYYSPGRQSTRSLLHRLSDDTRQQYFFPPTAGKMPAGSPFPCRRRELTLSLIFY